MAYVDGFVIPVPKKNLAAYKKSSKKMCKVFLEHGALEFREFVADDAAVGKVTSFPRSVKRKAGETVIFSYILFKSRAHRDAVNKKAMADPRLASIMSGEEMPFDGMRLIYGGFAEL
jgi:uncharacterized protein YbaA (DUF1428 family)